MKIDDFEHSTVEKIKKEIDFGRPGWYFIICALIGNLIIQYSKHPLLFIVGSLISVSSIYFLILWVAKLFYKNRKEQQGFVLVKKNSFLITIALCLVLLFTFVIVIIGAKNEAIKKNSKDGNTIASTALITPVQFNGNNNIFYPSMTELNNKAVQDSFNEGVKKIVDDEIKSFNKLAGEYGDKANTAGNSLELNYQIIGQNSNYISIKFIGYLYIAGGAHGTNELFSYNFDLTNGHEIKLEDIFKPKSGYLKIISEHTIKELVRRNKAEKFTNLEQISDGASPQIQNFKVFNITNKGLLFSFGDYQVAPYSASMQTVLIPFQNLKDILNLKI